MGSVKTMIQGNHNGKSQTISAVVPIPMTSLKDWISLSKYQGLQFDSTNLLICVKGELVLDPLLYVPCDCRCVPFIVAATATLNRTGTVAREVLLCSTYSNQCIPGMTLATR